MKETQERINRIQKQLSDANAELLSLADDIWLSIDHNNNEALQKGVAFKTAYNNKVSALTQLQADISKLIEDFLGEPAVKIDHSKIAKEPVQYEIREKEVRFLDDRVKHYLNENFTDKRPVGFVIRDTHFTKADSWRAIYLTTLEYLDKNFDHFDELLTSPAFISKRGNKKFSSNPEELREAAEVKPGMYAEVNLSANYIRNYIKQLLEHFGISTKAFWVYLHMEKH
ncbi:MAG: hypothetical protein JJU35_10575 [Balneolales bacterium]|nr:hypothetical protein [Balneolales bacterium]